MSDTITIVVDGASIEARRDETLAAALWNAGVRAFRRSVVGEPRAPVCGMGICFECRVTVDGAPHVRACMAAIRDGMRVETGAAPRDDSRS